MFQGSLHSVNRLISLLTFPFMTNLLSAIIIIISYQVQWLVNLLLYTRKR